LKIKLPVVKPPLNFPDLTGWCVWGATSWRAIRQIWGQVEYLLSGSVARCYPRGKIPRIHHGFCEAAHGIESRIWTTNLEPSVETITGNVATLTARPPRRHAEAYFTDEVSTQVRGKNETEAGIESTTLKSGGEHWARWPISHLYCCSLTEKLCNKHSPESIYSIWRCSRLAYRIRDLAGARSYLGRYYRWLQEIPDSAATSAKFDI